MPKVFKHKKVLLRDSKRCTACGIACPGVRDGGPLVLFKGHPLRCPVWGRYLLSCPGVPVPCPHPERTRDRTSGYPPSGPETGPVGILHQDQRQDQWVSSIRTRDRTSGYPPSGPETGPAGILYQDQRQDQRVFSIRTRDRTSGYPPSGPETGPAGILHQGQRQDQRVSSIRARDRTREYSLVDRQTPLKT